MPRFAASDLSLHCLPMSHLWDARHKRVNYYRTNLSIFNNNRKINFLTSNLIKHRSFSMKTHHAPVFTCVCLQSHVSNLQKSFYNKWNTIPNTVHSISSMSCTILSVYHMKCYSLSYIICKSHLSPKAIPLVCSFSCKNQYSQNLLF